MDASCRLGASLVEALLRRGYTVHATAYASADPFDYQSLVDAMKGCWGLFYEYMVEVEVRAAHNVLEACAQTETMERVVFTSSVTAVIWKEDRRSTVTVDERDWSEPNFCRRFKLWHALGKTLAEKTAWALAMDRGVEMISVNAALPTGPQLSVTNPSLKGAAEMYEDGVLVTVDVKLLVDAHVAVYESPSAYGRYICFSDAVCRPQDAIKLARMLSPNSSCAPPPRLAAPTPPASAYPLRVARTMLQSFNFLTLLEFSGWNRTSVLGSTAISLHSSDKPSSL
ncbi:hypothetical protein GW17_00012683 [Ensete ventricosum]|nr:hypothetical protein GW17_00012683 [Ensete ventricosum]